MTDFGGEPESSIDYWQRRGYSRRCPNCDGSGEIVIWALRVVSWDCRRCKGTGEIPVTEDQP